MRREYRYFWTVLLCSAFTLLSNEVKSQQFEPVQKKEKKVGFVRKALKSMGFMPVPPVVFSGPTNLCPGQSGTITITNATDYTGFLWGGGETTSFISVNSPGTYTVTVTDALGDTATETYTITSNSSITAILADITPQTSCTMFDGALDITVHPIGPPGTYSYAWSNGMFIEDISNLQAGHYSLTVTDGSSCTTVAVFSVGDMTLPPPLDIGLSPTTCMQDDGNIDLQPLLPGSNLAFLWSSGQTTEDLIQIFPGTYSVTVTDLDNGCTSIMSAMVNNTNFVPMIVPGVESPNTACVGLSNGVIEPVVEPDVVSYTYLWSNGATTPSLVNVPGGTYSVTVTHGLVCTASATFTIENMPASADLSANTLPEICHQTNGSIDLMPSPAGDYLYNWSNGAITEDITDALAGTYSVTVSSTTMPCTATATYVIADESIDFNFDGFMTPATHCATPNGGIDLSIYPPGSYDILWSNGATTEDLIGVPVGSYSVMVSLGGCADEASFNVEGQLDYPALFDIINPAVCGLSNGSIEVFSYPPVGNTYLWSNGATTEDLSNVPPGTYEVTTTSVNGCTTSATYEVANTDLGLSLSADLTANTACSGANGAVNLSVSPAGNYTYQWTNAATTQDLQNVAAGSYTVTVSAGGTCMYVANFVVPNSSGAPSLAPVASPASCGLATGNIDLTTSPSGTYTYTWSNGATIEDPQNLAPGNYSVTVTSTNGCSSTASVTVPNNTANFDATAVATSNTSCTSSNGSIDLSLNQPGSYVYVWSNGATSQDLQNLAPGNYTVTVTQGVNCTTSASYTVLDDSFSPSLAPTPTAATCGLSNGAIGLNVTPATGNSFVWSNGETSQDLQNLAPGGYAVTVANTNGCSSTLAVTVPDNPIVFTANGTVSQNTSCTSSNGGIDLTLSQPGNYVYAWSNGANSQDVQSLAPGNYNVTVTQGVNCTLSQSYTVLDDSPAPVISSNLTAATCGQSNGSINLSVTPATGNSFVWSNGATTQDLQNLAPAAYVVTCTAANGCTSIATIDLPNVNTNFALTATPVASTSCIAANGEIDLNITPVGTYTILWSNGATSQDLQAIPSGNYFATVTDASGCSDVASATVGGAVQPQVAISGPATACEGSLATLDADVGFANYLWSNGQTTSSINVSQPGVYDVTATDSEGCEALASHTFGTSPNPTPSITGPGSTCGNSAVFTVVGGNFAQTNWSTGDATPSITASQSGAYSVTVTDQNGCTATTSKTLTISTSLLPVIVTVISPCDGTASLDAGSGYATYIWSNGEVSQSISSNAEGQYSVTVSDGSGCSGEDVAQVDFPTLPQVQITGASSICLGASITFSVPDTYSQIVWSNGQTTSNVTITLPDQYSVTVTDINGCTATDVHDLALGGILSPNVTAGPPDCDGASTLDAGSGYASYHWSNGQNQQSITVVVSGTYSVTVSDALNGGCTGSDSEDVPIPPPTQVAIAGASSLCQGDETDLAAVGDFAQYEWSTGEATQQITISQGGTYSVTVTETSGCTTTDEWTVAQLLADVVHVQAVACSEQDTGTVQTLLTNQFGCDSLVVTTTALAQPIFMEVELGACEGEHVVFNGVDLPAGSSQTFVFTATNGCDSTVLVNVAAFPAVSFDLSATKTCWNAQEGAIEVEVLTGTAPYSLVLDGGGTQQEPLFENLSGGNHDITVMDANGCHESGSIEVPQSNPTLLSAEDATIPCDEHTVTLQPTVVTDDPNAIIWTWSNGSAETSLQVDKAGIYEVEVDDGCEVLSRSIRVDWDAEYYRTEFFYVPNSFSPNFDGINDDFRAFPGQDFEMLSFDFKVFDRWGDAMFIANDPLLGWDGINRAKELQPGVYVWYVASKVRVCGIREVDVFLKGNVTIVK